MDPGRRVHDVTPVATIDRALFERLPRLADIVPFVPLADGLPTGVDQLHERLWVQRDDRTDSHYGGNKVRKLEHLLAIAARRGGPVLTAGAAGSHHVVATAVHAARLGLSVEAVRFPQPSTPHVEAMAARADALGVRVIQARTSTLMPIVLARRWAELAPTGATLITPGGSTPVGVLGYVGAGLELAAHFRTSGWDEPDDVVVALGSGGTAVGLALGLALAGWRHADVVAVRVADRIVTNPPVLHAIEAGVRSLLALGGAVAPAARWRIDGRWFGDGYGHPTAEGTAAAIRAAELGLHSEPTYTAKALAAAFSRLDAGRRVVFLQTLAA
jgi:1-aminocyclopropane-1-carboxylate deaminase/D-cysteine desulfhydrase-like pyridoxal-dependent ACC family enzyme